MAVAYRDVATAQLSTSGTSISVPIPGGAQGQDLLLAVVALGTDAITNYTGPAGWSEFSWSPVTDSGRQANHFYYRVAGGSAGATTTDSNGSATWTSSTKGSCTVTAYSGVDTVTPINASNGTADTVNSVNCPTPSVTTTSAQCLAVAVHICRSGTAVRTWTPDSNLTERSDVGNSSATSAPYVSIEVADSATTVTQAAHQYTAVVSATAESHKTGALVYLNPTSGTPVVFATAHLIQGTSTTPSASNTVLANASLTQTSGVTPGTQGDQVATASLSQASSLSASASGTNVSAILNSWIGSPNPGTANGTSQTSVTLDVSACPLGDACLVAVATSESQTGITGPAGWTLIGQQDEARSHLAIFGKLKASTDTTATFSWPTTSKYQAIAFAYSGTSGTTFAEQFAAVAHTTATSGYTTGTATPGGTDRWAVTVTLARGSTAAETWMPDAALAERVDVCNAQTAFLALQVADSNGSVSQSAHSYTAVSSGADSHGVAALFYLLSAPAQAGIANLTTATGLSTTAAVTALPIAALTQSSALTAPATALVNASAALTMSSEAAAGGPAAQAFLSDGSSLAITARNTVPVSVGLDAGSSVVAVVASATQLAAAPLATGTALACSIATGRILNVSTSTQLTNALASAQPGDVIVIADGNYTGSTAYNYGANVQGLAGAPGAYAKVYTGSFVATGKGTADRPIIVTGGPGAILDGHGTGGHYGLYVVDAEWWVFQGFTVGGPLGANKGVVSDNGKHCVYDGLEIYNIGAEGLHLRSFSSYNEVKNCTIHHTGQKQQQFGEGIYNGSANSNWPVNSFGFPDISDYNWIHHNYVYDTGAENIDCKEGTTAILVEHNHFDGESMSNQNSADSSIDAKGNRWIFRYNNTTLSGPYVAYLDGFQVHQNVVVGSWGWANVFHDNTFDFVSGGFGPISGYAINIVNGSFNTSIADTNTQVGATSGVANLALDSNVAYLDQRTAVTVSAFIDNPGNLNAQLYTGTTMTVDAVVQGIGISAQLSTGAALTASASVTVLAEAHLTQATSESPVLEGQQLAGQISLSEGAAVSVTAGNTVLPAVLLGAAQILTASAAITGQVLQAALGQSSALAVDSLVSGGGGAVLAEQTQLTATADPLSISAALGLLTDQELHVSASVTAAITGQATLASHSVLTVSATVTPKITLGRKVGIGGPRTFGGP